MTLDTVVIHTRRVVLLINDNPGPSDPTENHVDRRRSTPTARHATTLLHINVVFSMLHRCVSNYCDPTFHLSTSHRYDFEMLKVPSVD